MCEVIDCTFCKKFMPCKVASKSEEVVICDQFDNLYAEDGIASLEELKAINASIPEDVIEPDYTGCEDQVPQ